MLNPNYKTCDIVFDTSVGAPLSRATAADIERAINRALDVAAAAIPLAPLARGTRSAPSPVLMR